MASFVVFNGITRFIPGGITKVNDEALNQVLAGDNSIVGVIGEADGGQPGVIQNFADVVPARNAYRSGPLADAAGLCFAPSNDADIPGGASLMRFYKTNASTQSTISLPSEEATEVLNTVLTGGIATTLIDTVLAATYADDYFINKWLVLRPFSATTEIRRVTDYDSATQTFTIGTAWASNPVAAETYKVLENEVLLADAVDAGSSTSTLVALKDVVLVASAHIGRTLYIQDAAGISYKRTVTANTTSAFTVAPALPATPTAGAFAEVLSNSVDLTSADWGAHTNGITADIASGVVVPGSVIATLGFEGTDEISPEVGGNAFFQLLYRGGAVAISDTVSGATSTVSVIDLVTGGLTISAHIGQQVLINGEYTTITANTANQLTVSPALSAAPAALDVVDIRTVTAGTSQVGGASGVATTLSTTLTGVVGDDLSITFTAAMTLRDLMNAVNANPNYLASLPDGVNPDVGLAADFDFGVNTNISILNSQELHTDGMYQNTMALVNYFNIFSELANAVRSTDDASEGGMVPSSFGAGEDPRAFTGGSRGVSTNTAFQAGHDALLNVRCNSVVPLIDQDLVNEGFGSTATVASVAAQLAAHVLSARGFDNTERGGFFGFRGTKTASIAQSKSINDFDVAMTAQSPTALNAAGALQLFGPRELSAMMAGMRAGAEEVGTPLTHKTMRINSITQDPSWDPTDRGDANEMIQAGILFHDGEKIVRDLTTYVSDNNLARTEGSVRDVVRYIAYGLRTFLVNRFVGDKASPATISSVKDATVEYLEIQRGDNVIVDSTDPSTGAFLKAFHNVKVTASGDIVKVNFGMFPAVGINFILNEVFVQLPTQSA